MNGFVCGAFFKHVIINFHCGGSNVIAAVNSVVMAVEAVLVAAVEVVGFFVVVAVIVIISIDAIDAIDVTMADCRSIGRQITALSKYSGRPNEITTTMMMIFH